MTGEPRFHASRADSGNIVHRGFCGACGSPVLSRNEGYPEMVVISAGSLDDSRFIAPTAAVFAANAPAWDPIDPGLRQFPGMFGS